MYNVIYTTYRKNRIGVLRAVPWSFVISRILNGISQIIFPYFIYHYFMHGNLNNQFNEYTNGADYMTYIVLGSALNILAVSTLMNIGRALITELREGTLEMLLLSPAPRSQYFLGCLLEQTTRALLEFGTVLITGTILGADLINKKSVYIHVYEFQTPRVGLEPTTPRLTAVCSTIDTIAHRKLKLILSFHLIFAYLFRHSFYRIIQDTFLPCHQHCSIKLFLQITDKWRFFNYIKNLLHVYPR